MAMLISRASGNFTSSSTWGVADSATGSQLTNPSASTNTTTSYVYSSTFTGTNTRVADGIALFLKRLTTTGTVTVALSDDNGVTATREVTVNASDLPADESWVFFKFGTTLTLDGGTDYRVGVVASSADNALIYRNATAGNWARMVSTTTTGAPAATDTMLIVGEWTGAGASSSYTVTMDNTASTTDFGTNSSSGVPTQTNSQTFNGIQIGQNGTLTWGTSAATNYYLRLSGHLVAWSGGTYNMGTSGTPCPRDSTMTLQFDSTGDGGSSTYALCAAAGSTTNVYGQSRTSGKNIVQCKLSADAAVNATSLTIDTDTGWLDNDEIAIAATTSDRTQCELGALNGAAGASTLTVDGFAGTAGGLAFAHSGTSPTQAEIINLSRNVVIRGNSTSQPTAVRSFVNATAFNIYWCRFSWTGSAAGSNLSAAVVSDIQYCAFFEYGGQGNTFRGATFSDNVSYSTTTSGTVLTLDGTVAPTLTNNTIIRSGNAGMTLSGAGTVPGGTFANNTIVGTASTPFNFNITSQAQNITFSNLTVHSCANSVQVNPTSTTGKTVTFSGLKIWRNTNIAMFSHVTPVIIDNADIFANALGGISCQNAANLALLNSRISSDSTATMPYGLQMSGANSIVKIENTKFSEVTGIYTANTVDINAGPNSTTFTRPMITLSNVLLGAATEVAFSANLDSIGFIKSSRHDQTEGAFKSWFSGGVVERDTTIFNTAAPSERLTPISATTKLASGPRLVAVDDGGTITINAYVRKSATGDGAAYNGNQPRLIVRANPACGITTDTVLDTMTVGTGTWEQLTGTTAAVDADGALEFYVDCDGTTGWINVDDWSVS